MLLDRFERLGRAVAPVAAALVLAVSAVAGAPAAQAAEESDAEVVAKLSDYLNKLSTMTGQFIQVAPNGRISEGQFAIRRPGRLRFAYSPPDPTLFVVDGFWVAVMDEEDDRSVDRFPLSETPLNLILKDKVDLAAEGVIADVEVDDAQYKVRAVDPDGEAQGDITLIFDKDPLQLKQWIVTDALGQTTTIVLRASEIGGPVENNLFVIPEPKDDRRER